MTLFTLYLWCQGAKIIIVHDLHVVIILRVGPEHF